MTTTRTRRSAAPATKKKPKPRKASFALGPSHALTVDARSDGARIAVSASDGSPALSLEIVMTPSGPALRVSAQSVELVAEGSLTARAKSLAFEASESVSIKAGGDAVIDARALSLEARVGKAKIQANDDVQLLGEQVLLNCERKVEAPPWAFESPKVPALMRLAESSGDAELLAAIGEAKP